MLTTLHIFVLPTHVYAYEIQSKVSPSYRRIAFNVINIAGFAAHKETK